MACTCRFHKMLGIPRLAEELLVSQEGLFSMELYAESALLYVIFPAIRSSGT
jgi:hypothetical protein